MRADFFLKSRLFLVRNERGPEEGGEGGGQQGGGPRTTGADSWNTRTTPKAEIRQVQCANIFLDVFYLGMSYKESFRCNNYFTTASFEKVYRAIFQHKRRRLVF